MPRAARTAALRSVRDVAIGGAVGALLRTGVALVAVVTVDEELGIVVALNLVGTYLLARLIVRARHDPSWLARLPLIGTGVLGSLTTFSGLVVPVAVLAADHRPGAAVAWAGGNLVLGAWVAARGLGARP